MSSILQSMTSLAARMTLRLAGRSRLAVMTFHRVGRGYPIQTSHIRYHMELLARHFEIVTPTQFLESPSRHPMAMVTIDDSHRDIYEYIYPVAQSLKAPITICVPTDFFLRDQWLWFDQLAWMHEHCSPVREVDIGGRHISLADPHSVVQLKRHLKTLLPPERNALLRRVAQEAGCAIPPAPTDGYEALTHAEMREMLASGTAEICAHGVTHTIATVLPDAEFRRELSQSKAELEAFSGREVPCFCYPNGVAGDFDEKTSQAVRDAGFGMAFTSVPGGNDAKTTDRFLIRRVHARTNTHAFTRNISVFGDIRLRFSKTVAE